MAAFGYKKQGRQVVISVAEDLSTIEAGLQRFHLIHGTVSFIILTVLLVLQYLILTRSLKPLDKIRADMHLLESGSIDSIEIRNAPSEISPLIK
ncbi:MAG TPA: hypothetical protein VEF04_02625 [Blastocatellia bacterium]|nr:hypothetical protein [Blastocatellia bacterium]